MVCPILKQPSHRRKPVPTTSSPLTPSYALHLFSCLPGFPILNRSFHNAHFFAKNPEKRKYLPERRSQRVSTSDCRRACAILYTVHMKAPTFNTILRARITPSSLVFVSPSLHTLTAGENPETEFQLAATPAAAQAMGSEPAVEVRGGGGGIVAAVRDGARKAVGWAEEAACGQAVRGSSRASSERGEGGVSPGGEAVPARPASPTPFHPTSFPNEALSKAAPESASADLPYVGKDTTICSETPPPDRGGGLRINGDSAQPGEFGSQQSRFEQILPENPARRHQSHLLAQPTPPNTTPPAFAR